MSVSGTSIEAYHELKQEGKLTERQQLAFETIRDFYEEKGYWPTPKEVHTFLALEKAHALAQFEGPNYVKPRITELIVDNGDESDPDLLEKQDARKQQYIEEKLNSRGHEEYDSKSANPVKIIGYQSTLSGEEGEAAELNDEEECDSASFSEDSDSDQPEIGYTVDLESGGTNVLRGSPEEAIEKCDDLDFVENQLKQEGLLDEYKEEVKAARSNSRDSEDDVDDTELIEKDGEQYLFDPDEKSEGGEEEDLVSNDGGDDAKDSVSCSDETKAEEDPDEEEKEVLMEDGEVIC